ncbi:unnamed protein product, partial [Lampetra fluviatilis]
FTNKYTKSCGSKEICAAISVANDVGLSLPYCCATNLCNRNVVPTVATTPTPVVPNALKCYKCDDQISNDQCMLANSTVSCSASGEQCYANKNPLTNKISKGCNSKAICSAISVANGVGFSMPYCCNTSLCNMNITSTPAPSVLKCYKCDDQTSNDPCTMANSTVDCSASGDQCYANKNPLTNKISKGCNSKAICSAISVANGVGFSTPYCCNTSLCNMNITSTPAPSVLKCYKCDDQTSNDPCTMANSTVDCSASGDQCYANKNPLTNKISKGCNSKTICSAISVANGVGFSTPYCCNTSLCNANVTSTPSGLTCYKCDDQTSNVPCTMANSTVDCSASGQQCKASKNLLTKKINKGCGNKVECAAFSVANLVGYTFTYCCNTNLCNTNGASTLAPSLITSAPLMAASILAALVASTRLEAF